MKITLTIDSLDIAGAAAILAAIPADKSSDVRVVKTPTPTPAKKPAPAPAPVEEPEEEEENFFGDEEEEPEVKKPAPKKAAAPKKVTKEECTTAAKEFMETNEPDDLRAIFNSFKKTSGEAVGKISELQPKDYAAFHAKVSA